MVEYSRSDIEETHPDLYKQLVMYYIMPSWQTMNEIKEFFQVDTIEELKDYKLTHDMLMELKKTQLARSATKRMLDSIPMVVVDKTLLWTNLPSMPKEMKR